MIEIHARIYIEGCDELEETGEGQQALSEALALRTESLHLPVGKNVIIKLIVPDRMECVDD